MKTLFLTSLLLWTSSHPLCAASPILPAAHEWGTFTTISGSDGDEIPWWTPKLEGPAELPEFVSSIPSFTKSGGAFLMRMETPVIYFYPREPMKVTVRVSYPSGRLTEAFPAMDHGQNFQSSYQWTVNLLPPAGTNANEIPPVKTRGAHYRHAREVPDAWIVRGTSQPALTSTSSAKQTEKFIFYRGAGAGQMPLHIRLASDTDFVITPRADIRSDAFLIRVKDGTTSWNPITLASTKEENGRFTEQRFTLPITAAAERNHASLIAALTRSLITNGLSSAEAAAMVATWNDAWFHEEGTRVLYLLPLDWINTALPLQIEPMPAELRRVFVARAEIITPSQEQTLASTLSTDLTDKQRAEKITILNHGRFLTAALDRAVIIKEQELRDSFYRAIALAEKKIPTQ